MPKKIMRVFLISLCTLPLIATAGSYQWDASPTVNGQQSGYQSTMGNTYQYDLSNPVDRMRYSTDVSAQVRDSTSVNPTRSLDRDMGQIGGGIYTK